MKKQVLSSIIASVLCFNSLCISPSLVKNVNAETFEIADSPYTFRGHTYYVFDGVAGSWEEAQEYCESLGGYLAVINDMAENTYLYSLMTSLGYESAYFGYTDRETEDVWKWVDNDKSTFSNFNEEEPNNGMGYEDENYAMFYFKYTDGTWNDGNFGSSTEGLDTAFICEWDSAVPHTPNEDGSFDLKYTGNLTHKQETVNLSKAYDIDLYACNASSKKYQPKLAYLLSILASSAYTLGDLDYNLNSLGFDDCNYYDYYVDPVDINYDEDSCAFAIAQKQLINGNRLVLIDIRGSVGGMKLKDLVDSVTGEHNNSDWNSNMNIWMQEMYGYGKHSGFDIAMKKVYDQLQKDMGGKIPKTGITYMITGHSRGAGIANLLAKKLIDDGVSIYNVFDYNFACPDVAKDISINWNFMNKYDNIYNIGVAGDPVTIIPGVVGNIISDKVYEHTPFWKRPRNHIPSTATQWGKYGNTCWFSDDWKNVSSDLQMSYHASENYVRILSYENEFSQGKSWKELKLSQLCHNIQTFKIMCPVDAEIVDVDGNVLASVYGDEVYYNTDSDFTVVVWHEDDQKNFIILGRTDLQVNLVGTDEGTMDCLVSVIQDGELKTESVVYYEDVELYDGKEMRLEISEDGKNVADKLYVFNDEKDEIITPNFYAPFRLYGDINADGEIKVSDAVLLQKYILASGELTAEQGIVADMNQDESIDVFDMVLMRKRLIANK